MTPMPGSSPRSGYPIGTPVAPPAVQEDVPEFPLEFGEDDLKPPPQRTFANSRACKIDWC
jgi:hypothetical protein